MISCNRGYLCKLILPTLTAVTPKFDNHLIIIIYPLCIEIILYYIIWLCREIPHLSLSFVIKYLNSLPFYLCRFLRSSSITYYY